MQGEIWRRSRYLVVTILGELEDGAVLLPALVARLSRLAGPAVDGVPPAFLWSAKTVENTLLDLCSFGAIRKIDRNRDRFVEVTVLGRAWLAGVLLPGPGEGDLLRVAMVELLADGDGELHHAG